MSSATTYTAHIQEFKKDREQLEANGYRLQLAKAVSTDGALPTSNVVYASRILAPDMSITWEENYGFNWVQDMSKPGAKVTYSGEWVAVKLGETFNLDKTGGWVKQNGAASDANALNIGSNDYKIPVHIIVGVKTADKVTPQNPQGWTPIYVSPKQILISGSGQYVPKENIEIWYDTKDDSATMISTQQTYKEEFDMAGKPEWWFHWDHTTGKWQDQGSAFPVPSTPIALNEIALGKVTNEDDALHAWPLFNPRVIVRTIQFTPAIERLAKAALITQITTNIVNAFGKAPTIKFSADDRSVTVSWPQKSESFADVFSQIIANLSSSFGSHPTIQLETSEKATSLGITWSQGSLAFARNEIFRSGGVGDAEIDAALKLLQSQGILPADEKWQIDDTQN